MENKLAVITGAASGIGLALAKLCVKKGMNIVMTDIDAPLLNEEVATLRTLTDRQVLGIVCDVSNESAVKAMALQTIEHFNQVDLLINNAGICGSFSPIWTLSTTEIRRVLDVNLYGVIHGIQAFLPLMVKQENRSQIINMASFYGLCSSSQMAPYAMSKHAIVALTESLHFDLKKLNIPVDTAVACPSFINTPLLKNWTDEHKTNVHHKVEQLMTHARDVDDVAECIMREIENRTFYILPDKEIKHDCEQRIQSIINQSDPYEHGMEKILSSMNKVRVNR